jgi:hypothetical protein
MNGINEIEILEINELVKHCACIYAAVKHTTGSTQEYHQKKFDKWSALLKEAIQMADVGWVNNEAVPVYSKKLLATLVKKYFTKEVNEHLTHYGSGENAKAFLAALNE